MFDSGKKLDLTTKDLEMIEAALHTQKKILSMQSEAGRTGARQKLSDLRHLMQRIGRSRRTAPETEPVSWSLFGRTLFGDVHSIKEGR